jgi:hypothetical protein
MMQSRFRRSTTLGALLLLPSATLMSTNALAEISFTPRATLAFSSYKFTQTARPGALPASINGGEFPEVKFDVVFQILGIGGTFFSNGYYLDLSASRSADEEDSFEFEPLSFKETFKGDRSDTNITFGRKILDNRGAVYIGYKTGKSQADGDQGQRLVFEEKGFFIGGNYSWPVMKSSVITLNVAYASLDGDLTEDVTNPGFIQITEDNGLPPLDINASSDATGLSYSLGFASRLTDTLSYSVAYEIKSYTFDSVKDDNPAVITSDEFEEKFKGLSLSLFFQF